MKCVGVIVLMMMSFTAMCHGNDSTSVKVDNKVERKLERKKARIERQRQRIMNKWDDRTVQQKRMDRRVLILLTLTAGVLVKSLAPGVE